MEDPRYKNEKFTSGTVSEYLSNYSQKLSESLKKIDATELFKTFELIIKTLILNKRIYVGGNGGSAAIGDHLCCDWMKGTYYKNKPSLKVQSLTANTPLFTALANDFGYDQTLAQQIEYLGEENDVLILISSSGNSPNIIKAAEMAKVKKMKVIGFSGFSGGELKEISDINIYISANNYGIVEDAHQIVMHTLGQYINQEREKISAN